MVLIKVRRNKVFLFFKGFRKLVKAVRGREFGSFLHYIFGSHVDVSDQRGGGSAMAMIC